MRILRFRVSGVRPTWNTAYVTGGTLADAPAHIVDALRTRVRERFAELYPDAIHLREYEWTEGVQEQTEDDTECRVGGERYPEHTDDDVCRRCGAEMEQISDE